MCTLYGGARATRCLSRPCVQRARPSRKEWQDLPQGAGKAWGKNAMSFKDWDHLEEGATVLRKAAGVSQLLEGDKYPTVSLIMPSMYKLISDSLRE